MSSTRRAKPGSDPDASPEKYLASARLRGLVGLNIVCRVACVLPQEEREAMIFLANYARLREMTAADVSEELRLPGFAIRQALTNPTYGRRLFVERVNERRERFLEELETARPVTEASPYDLVPAFDEALRRPADTSILRKIQNAVKMCAMKPQLVLVEGPARIGKSIAGRREYLANLHRSAFVHVPRHGTERDFLGGLAGSLGMSFGSSMKNNQIISKIMACFGRRKINLLFLDEAHRLLPVETNAEPRRLEWVRDAWELAGISIVLLSTPQMSAGMAKLMTENDRWAPAQAVGRIQRFDLPPTMSRTDLEAVARHYAPEADEEVIAALVSHAMEGEGMCSAITLAVERARFRVAGGPLTLQEVTASQRLLTREFRASQLAGRKVVPIRASSAPAVPSDGQKRGSSTQS